MPISFPFSTKLFVPFVPLLCFGVDSVISACPMIDCSSAEILEWLKNVCYYRPLITSLSPSSFPWILFLCHHQFRDQNIWSYKETLKLWKSIYFYRWKKHSLFWFIHDRKLSRKLTAEVVPGYRNPGINYFFWCLEIITPDVCSFFVFLEKNNTIVFFWGWRFPKQRAPHFHPFFLLLLVFATEL